MKITRIFASYLAAGALAVSAQPALTIYNQDFAVVRDTVPLDLNAGVNNVNYPGATAQVEPDSVILRDPAGRNSLQILEQNYRNDPVSQGLLLSLFEGKTIDFQTTDRDGQPVITHGKIIRSGYVQGGDPIIEMDGKMRFGLPGQPLFPDLGDDTILKPTLNWLIQADKPGKVNAEVGYVTGGFSWEAAYNLVSPEKGDDVDFIGWITIKNQSGTGFKDAKIKLIAGNVNKIQNPPIFYRAMMADSLGASKAAGPPVTEKAFDEYHLYSLQRPTTFRDNETKQVEFVQAEDVHSKTIYVYDGADKIHVMREFTNSELNHLGIALPKGKLRFYRRDADGQLEFVGEDQIDHTPKDETIRVTTGDAFDLVGERKQTNFQVDNNNHWADESYETKLRNHKKTAVTIRVVEHLYRWNNWEITSHSDDFTKIDAQTIQINVPVKPDEERTLDYTVHYSW